MQVTSYNPHLGLLRSEHCWGEHRTVYSGRSEADVVMASINQELSQRNSTRSLCATDSNALVERLVLDGVRCVSCQTLGRQQPSLSSQSRSSRSPRSCSVITSGTQEISRR